MLTKDEIDELERMEMEATQGDWIVLGQPDGDSLRYATIRTNEAMSHLNRVVASACGRCGGLDIVAKDAALIVHVRNLLPRIIAALREKS